MADTQRIILSSAKTGKVTPKDAREAVRAAKDVRDKKDAKPRASAKK